MGISLAELKKLTMRWLGAYYLAKSVARTKTQYRVVAWFCLKQYLANRR